MQALLRARLSRLRLPGRLRPVAANPVYLLHRRVYILPTRAGLVYAAALLLMLIAAINYQLSLGYMLTFLLAGTGVVALLHTYRNLVHLRIDAGKSTTAFAGDTVEFKLRLHNPGHYERIAISLHGAANTVQCDVPARDAHTLSIRLPTTQRGWLELPRLRLQTTYPLGLFCAWAYAQLDARALVYPRPDVSSLPPPALTPDTGAQIHLGEGREDFQGLRSYQPSDSPRHIAWKSLARNDLLLTKLFNGGAAPSERWLDYASLPPALGVEARLARLTGQVLLVHADGTPYGLRLPGCLIPPATGEAHRAACLRALALYGME